MPRTLSLRAKRQPARGPHSAGQTVLLVIGHNRIWLTPGELETVLALGAFALPEACRMAGRTPPRVVLAEVHPSLAPAPVPAPVPAAGHACG